MVQIMPSNDITLEITQIITGAAKPRADRLGSIAVSDFLDPAISEALITDMSRKAKAAYGSSKNLQAS